MLPTSLQRDHLGEERNFVVPPLQITLSSYEDSLQQDNGGSSESEISPAKDPLASSPNAESDSVYDSSASVSVLLEVRGKKRQFSSDNESECGIPNKRPRLFLPSGLDSESGFSSAAEDTSVPSEFEHIHIENPVPDECVVLEPSPTMLPNFYHPVDLTCLPRSPTEIFPQHHRPFLFSLTSPYDYKRNHDYYAKSHVKQKPLDLTSPTKTCLAEAPTSPAKPCLNAVNQLSYCEPMTEKASVGQPDSNLWPLDYTFQPSLTTLNKSCEDIDVPEEPQFVVDTISEPQNYTGSVSDIAEDCLKEFFHNWNDQSSPIVPLTLQIVSNSGSPGQILVYPGLELSHVIPGDLEEEEEDPMVGVREEKDEVSAVGGSTENNQVTNFCATNLVRVDETQGKVVSGPLSMPLLGGEPELPPIVEEPEEEEVVCKVTEPQPDNQTPVSESQDSSGDTQNKQVNDPLPISGSQNSDTTPLPESQSSEEATSCIWDKILNPTLPRNSTISYSRFFGSEENSFESFLSRKGVSPTSRAPTFLNFPRSRTPTPQRPTRIQPQRRASVGSSVSSESPEIRFTHNLRSRPTTPLASISNGVVYNTPTTRSQRGSRPSTPQNQPGDSRSSTPKNHFGPSTPENHPDSSRPSTPQNQPGGSRSSTPKNHFGPSTPENQLGGSRSSSPQNYLGPPTPENQPGGSRPSTPQNPLSWSRPSTPVVMDTSPHSNNTPTTRSLRSRSGTPEVPEVIVLSPGPSKRGRGRPPSIATIVKNIKASASGAKRRPSPSTRGRGKKTSPAGTQAEDPEALLIARERHKLMQYDSWLEQRRLLYSALLPGVVLRGSPNMQPSVRIARDQQLDARAISEAEQV